MSVHISENDGNLTLMVDGRPRGIKLKDAEGLRDELTDAIEEAKAARE